MSKDISIQSLADQANQAEVLVTTHKKELRRNRISSKTVTKQTIAMTRNPTEETEPDVQSCYIL